MKEQFEQKYADKLIDEVAVYMCQHYAKDDYAKLIYQVAMRLLAKLKLEKPELLKDEWLNYKKYLNEEIEDKNRE